MPGGGGGGPTYDYSKLAESNRYAADLQKEAADKALKLMESQYRQTRADWAPWRDAGVAALDEIRTGIAQGRWTMPEWRTPDADAMMRDPGYAFRLREGERGLQRQLAAQGVSGGAAVKAAARYHQDYAAQEYGRSYDRALTEYMQNQARLNLMHGRRLDLTGYGYGATGQGTNQALQAAGAQAQQMHAGAAALGQGAIGAANAEIMQQQADNAARAQRRAARGGILQAGAMIGGFLVGGPAGAAVGGALAGGYTGGASGAISGGIGGYMMGGAMEGMGFGGGGGRPSPNLAFGKGEYAYPPI